MENTEQLRFTHKTVVNRDGFKSGMKREPHYYDSGRGNNFGLLKDYFFLRRFLQCMAEEDKDLIITGSNSHVMHAGPFRVPTDIDLKTPNAPEDVFALVRHLADKGVSPDSKHSIGKSEITPRGVLKTVVNTDFWGMSGSFGMDIIHDPDAETIIKPMRYVLTSDQPFEMKTLTFDDTISGKIHSILDKFGRENGAYYRIKDFYDLYMLCRGKNPDIKSIIRYLNKRIEQCGNSRENFRDICATMQRRTAPTQDQTWELFKRQNRVDADLTAEKLVNFGTSIINEMEI